MPFSGPLTPCLTASVRLAGGRATLPGAAMGMTWGARRPHRLRPVVVAAVAVPVVGLVRHTDAEPRSPDLALMPVAA